MTILDNAISSIEVGIEDYAVGSDKRNISAVRNVFAGILLLFKEKLVRLSPENDRELLIKKSILPVLDSNQNLIFQGSGKNTVDVYSIKERFESLGVSVDWKKLDEINRLRNDIEHYYTKESSENIREMLAKSFLIMREFLVNELKEDPTELIERDCWSMLLDIEEVYTAQEDACKKSMEDVKWKYQTLKDAISDVKCCICNSSLVKFKEQIGDSVYFQCMSCGEDLDSYIYEQCIEDYFRAEAFAAAVNGDDAPYGTCPNCDTETYVMEEDACVSCNYSGLYKNCMRCNNSLSFIEREEGLCGYCAYVADKLMRE